MDDNMFTFEVERSTKSLHKRDKSNFSKKISNIEYSDYPKIELEEFECPAPVLLEDVVEKPSHVRLDKWLWAARFFKTRALARSAVKNRRVFFNGKETVPSKEIEIGDKIYIMSSNTEKLIVVKGLSTRRRSPDEAMCLYDILKNTTKESDAADSYGIISATPSVSKPSGVVRFLRRTFMQNKESEPGN